MTNGNTEASVLIKNVIKKYIQHEDNQTLFESATFYVHYIHNEENKKASLEPIIALDYLYAKRQRGTNDFLNNSY